MPLSPYLHFQGNCAEAVAAYARIFGAPEPKAMQYPDTPAGQTPRIMHTQVPIAGGALMASDFPHGTAGDAQKAVTVSVTLPDVATARAAFDGLAEGGAVIEGFGPTFFSPGYGMLRDRFGMHWIVMAEATT